MESLVEKFVSEQNIVRLTDKFYCEADQARQHTLLHLLVAEEDRFTVGLWQLEVAQRHIAESTLRIRKQTELISTMNADGHDTTEAERVLRNFVAIRQAFQDFQARIADRLDRSRF
jgi:hypothetical protein